jgi:transposase
MVAECAEPGASVSLVARKYDVNANLLFSWRRQFAPALDLIPISVMAGATPAPAARDGAMEITLSNGARVRVDASVDERALRRVLAAMKAVG